MERDYAKPNPKLWAMSCKIYRKLIFLAGVGCMLILFSSPVISYAADWPMLWYDTKHSFACPDTKIRPPLKLLWKYGGDVVWPHVSMRSRPVVANGMVYTLAKNSNNIIALDAYKGTVRWVTKDGSYYGCMATDGKRLCAVEENCQGTNRDGFVALDLNTGKWLWTFPFPTGEGWLGSYKFSTVTEDTLYFAPRGGVYALNTADGSLRWHFKVEKPAWNTPPAIADGVLYFVSEGDRKVYALNSRTGQVKWSKEVTWAKSANFEGIAYYQGKLYMPNAPKGKVYCVKANDGTFLFETEKEGYNRFPYVAEGMIYTYRSSLTAFSASDGSFKWEVKAKGDVGSCGQMVVANNLLWLVGPHVYRDRSVRALDPATGKLLWETDWEKINCFSCNGPVIAEGILYLTTNDHNFYAFVPVPEEEVSEIDKKLMKAIRRGALSEMPEVCFEGVKNSGDRFLVTECLLNLISRKEDIDKVVSLIGKKEMVIWKQLLIIAHVGERCGEKAGQVLQLGMADEGPYVRKAVVKILANLDIPERFDLLVRGILDGESEVRNVAVDVLLAIGDIRAANALAEAITRKENIFTELSAAKFLNVVKVLGEGKGERGKKVLSSHLTSKDLNLRLEAIKSIARVVEDNEELKRLLQPLKSDSEKKVRLEVMRVFAERKIGLEDKGKEEDILPDIPE